MAAAWIADTTLLGVLVFLTLWCIDTCLIFGKYLMGLRQSQPEQAVAAVATEGVGAISISGGTSCTGGNGGSVTLCAGDATGNTWYHSSVPLTIKRKELLNNPDCEAQLDYIQSDVDGNGYWGRQMYLYDIYGPNYLSVGGAGNGQTQA